MQQIRKTWASLDTRKQVVLVASVVAVFVCLILLSRMAARPTMTLLYAGLEGQTAGETIRAIEGLSIPYEVRGGSIFVPSDQRDELRMTLAGEGLPAPGARGYELLDSLSGFGTTSQMFDAAYRRAKEGELARTIVASRFASQARVHIANSETNPFRRNGNATASVSVVPSGASITPTQANALRYLVASAVAGMSVDDVAIIDADGVLIGSPEDTGGTVTAEDRSQLLRERVLRLLEARVGQGNAIVEISVETVTETESIRERRFDPNERIAISTDVEERADSSQNQSGDVTIASNLPDGDVGAGDGSQANNSSTRERINYEVSQTELEILRIPGDVKRLSVAVLVNGLTEGEPDGASVFEPRTEEEMAALQELVESAVGFNAERGDVITLKSMELPAVVTTGTTVSASLFQKLQLDVMSLVQMGVLATLALVLGLFVVRPVLATQGNAILPPPVPALDSETDSIARSETVHTGEIDDGLDGQFNPAPEIPSVAKTPLGTAISVGGGAEGTPVDRLRNLIGERQEETVEILRNWLEESEEKV